jgi:hypothetical protein
MNIEWKKPEEWDEDPTAFPNEEVLLLMEIAGGDNPLVDEMDGFRYCTMGHWMPANGDEDGYWEYVGWDWDQDCFVSTTGDKVVGWSPMPDTGGRRRGGKGFVKLKVVP